MITLFKRPQLLYSLRDYTDDLNITREYQALTALDSL